jgi:hypothetical protein
MYLARTAWWLPLSLLLCASPVRSQSAPDEAPAPTLVQSVPACDEAPREGRAIEFGGEVYAGVHGHRRLRRFDFHLREFPFQRARPRLAEGHPTGNRLRAATHEIAIEMPRFV